jgi:dTDP-glucose pyrophosphorylase
LNQKISGVILTAAKADITICEVFGYLPTGLIPVNGKPIIFFILEQMIENGIKDVYIGVDYKQEKLQEIVNIYFSNKLNISYVVTDKTKGPGNSLLQILRMIESGQTIINLGDTYIKNLNYRSLNDTLIVSSDFLDEERWAIVKCMDNEIIRFMNKEKVNGEHFYAICGLYCLNNIEVFNNISTLEDNTQIIDLLQYYNKENRLTVKKTDEWLDFGHIDKYYISKKRLIQSRGFNHLEYDDLLGIITKKSENKEKFRSEIRWQLELPKNIKVLAPRVLDYSLGEAPFIAMEFYSYPTLAEIWLFSELNDKMYFSIIDRLFKILELFSTNKKDVSKSDYHHIYIDKTIKRIQNIENTSILKLLESDTIYINGKLLQNWKQLEKKIFHLINELYTKKDNCFIHGDFCLSNLLYDLRSGIVRLIDPRGMWGSSENGDIKYDIAKLRHSICGDYDYIVNDLFSVKSTSDKIKYTIFNSDRETIKNYFDSKLSNYYNLNQIKLIEGLLFLSMIALHKDNEKRQLVMYAKSIELLNQVVTHEEVTNV